MFFQKKSVGIILLFSFLFQFYIPTYIRYIGIYIYMKGIQCILDIWKPINVCLRFTQNKILNKV